MRWDELTTDAEESRQLPGYRDPAAVRTFDAPEALDTRFYEVRARSALNRVPKASRMPFRWTVNPYRGCTHACVYCADGDTPILLPDGRMRALRDLRPGDAIVGTVRAGGYRRYERTTVLAHWSSVKPAYRVTLADGTELIASGDHRFLTERGFKHVADAGDGQRPHLTTSNELRGTGRFTPTPPPTADYRRGYLSGVIRGDGHRGSYTYERPGRPRAQIHTFRLALADGEGLSRSAEYLAVEGIRTRRRLFAAAGPSRRESEAIATGRRDDLDRIRDVVAWPSWSNDEWCRGFLAGLFDAEGSCGAGALRISNSDSELLGWATDALRRFGFDVVRERWPAPAVGGVRIRGGLRERLRFFQLADPAIRRKLTIGGIALESDANLHVVEIEPLGERRELFDITTGTGDFIADGVVSHNCFARPTHKYLDLSPGRDFEREIVVKVNAPEALAADLAKPSWRREHVALGTNTDPYQWVEGRYRLMPGIWRALRDARTPCSVLTKSPLLLRDVELLRELADLVGFTASLSVPTLDERAWRASEPRTPNPRARLEAVAELNRAGVPTGVMVAPLMPGINDDPRQVERILELAGEAGATGVGGICLHLRGEVRGVFMDWLRSYRPDLVPRYERLYANGAYAPPAERKRIAALTRHRSDSWPRAFRRLPPPSPPDPPPPPDQPTLF